MKSLPYAFVAISLFVAGVLGGRALYPASGRSAAISANEEMADRTGPGKNTPSAAERKSNSRHTLASLTAIAARGNRAGALRSSLARLDAQALRTLATDQYSAMMLSSGEDMAAHLKLLEATLEELWDRTGTAAFEWTSMLEGKEQRGYFTKRILESGLRDDPSAAIPWMRQYHAEYGKMETETHFFMLAAKGAVDHGVDEVIRIFGEFKDCNFSNPLNGVRYPEDFDFAKLHAELGAKTDLSDAITAWAARDPDSAWDAVMNGGKRPAKTFAFSNPFSSLIMGVIARDGEAAGMEWTAEQVIALKKEQRIAELKNLDSGNQFSTTGVTALAAGLSPEDRVVFAASIVRNSGSLTKTHALLDSLSREDLLKTLRQSSMPQSGDAFRSNSIFAPPSREAAEREIYSRYQLTEPELAEILKTPEHIPGARPYIIYDPKE